MKFLIQRVSEASVAVEGNVIGSIEKGFLVLIGVSDRDTEETADKLVRKMTGLRIFEDENGKTNLSLADVDGSLLLISQFTLYANCKKGNRPSFIEAGQPDRANALYEYIIEECRALRPQCADRKFRGRNESQPHQRRSLYYYFRFRRSVTWCILSVGKFVAWRRLLNGSSVLIGLVVRK